MSESSASARSHESPGDELPLCTRCGHPPHAHRVSSDATVQDPTDERARFRCVGWTSPASAWIEDCDCPNYERWTRP